MGWYWIVLITVACCAAVGGTAAIFGCRKKKKTKLLVSPVDKLDEGEGDEPVNEISEPPKLYRIEEVPLEEIDESKLCEIEDVDVTARVKNLVPELVKAEVSAGTVINLASKTVYKVILPAGTKLAGAASGASLMTGGAAMAAGQVGALVSSSITSLMSAVSMVVGQYYMTRVNIQLKKIGESISRMSDFQDNEFKSKVFALNAQIRRSSLFRTEIVESPEVRAAEIAKLNTFEHECIELLGQADLMISGSAQKTDLSYEQYVREVSDIQNWFISQNILIEMLTEIADLRFALHLGAASREQCDALLPIYMNQSTQTHRQLSGWHEYVTDKLGIDLKEGRRKRQGVDKAIHFLPGLFKKDMKFREVPSSTVTIIEQQISGEIPPHKEGDNLFNEDVELIYRDGKLFYLPFDRVTAENITETCQNNCGNIDNTCDNGNENGNKTCDKDVEDISEINSNDIESDNSCDD